MAIFFMNNSSYYYIGIIKPNALLATFLSKHDEDRFCLTTLVIFKLTKNLKQQKKSCRDCYHADMEIP